MPCTKGLVDLSRVPDRPGLRPEVAAAGPMGPVGKTASAVHTPEDTPRAANLER